MNAMPHGFEEWSSEAKLAYRLGRARTPLSLDVVALTPDAIDVLCGLVHPTGEVNEQGIVSEAWEELRQTFPLERFRARAKRDPDFYLPDAGT